METPGSDGDASTLPVTVSQVAEGPNVLIKRILSKIESMEQWKTVERFGKTKYILHL